MAQEDEFIREVARESRLSFERVKQLYNMYYNGSVMQFYEKVNEESKERKNY